MFEKVNPSHPDKVADRIAGALVDYCYKRVQNPKCAFEVLIGHGKCHIAGECSVRVPWKVARDIVRRIAGEGFKTYYEVKPQDAHLAENQSHGSPRCGDNGIFKGVPTTEQQKRLTRIAKGIYERFPTDGKYVSSGGTLIICQSHGASGAIKAFAESDIHLLPEEELIVNPLGDWTGGPDVDTGATNRKLGSDMGDAVTGGGLHGKDLSKADVSANIYAHVMANRKSEEIKGSCAIGDERIFGVPYTEVVAEAKAYIDAIGGFEKLAEWGLIR